MIADTIRLTAETIRMVARYVESRPPEVSPRQMGEELFTIARWVALSPRGDERQ
jgi:hypothetical protein